MSSKIFTSLEINPHKPAWEYTDWHIYINNLEILCAKNGIRKKDLSRRIGVANAFRTAAGKPSPETINKIAEAFQTTPEWLFTYHDKLTPNVKHGVIKYDLPVGSAPRGGEPVADIPGGIGFGQAVEMLSKIYSSRNAALISSICANLRVFCERVAQDDQIAGLKREVAELRELVKNHAKAHAYYGEDRRSGIERRQQPGESPTGAERRSGADRRRQEETNGIT